MGVVYVPKQCTFSVLLKLGGAKHVLYWKEVELKRKNYSKSTAEANLKWAVHKKQTLIGLLKNGRGLGKIVERVFYWK